eukprot:1395723-Ditylum_brightwellii.AAC.1
MAVWSIVTHVWIVFNAHHHTDMEEIDASLLNKQVRKAHAFKHSIFASDQILLTMPLSDRLEILHE